MGYMKVAVSSNACEDRVLVFKGEDEAFPYDVCDAETMECEGSYRYFQSAVGALDKQVIEPWIAEDLHCVLRDMIDMDAYENSPLYEGEGRFERDLADVFKKFDGGDLADLISEEMGRVFSREVMRWMRENKEEIHSQLNDKYGVGLDPSELAAKASRAIEADDSLDETKVRGITI